MCVFQSLESIVTGVVHHFGAAFKLSKTITNTQVASDSAQLGLILRFIGCWKFPVQRALNLFSQGPASSRLRGQTQAGLGVVIGREGLQVGNLPHGPKLDD
jgi:hypothetical protein